MKQISYKVPQFLIKGTDFEGTLDGISLLDHLEMKLFLVTNSSSIRKLTKSKCHDD